MVDLSSGSVVIRHHRDLQRLSALVRPKPEDPGTADRGGSARRALADVLGGHDSGTVEPDGDLVVPEAALRRLAGVEAAAEGQALGAQWESEFTGMLAYAATKGWVAEDGSVRVHVEWRD